LTSPARLSEGKIFSQHFGLYRRHAIDYLLPPETMVDEMLAYQPDVFYANRSHIDLMCQEFKRRNIRYDRLKLILPGAEVIRERNRKMYREIFQAEIAEYYGTVEMGILAFETPSHDGLELCEDLTYYEFLDEDGNPARPGERSRIVVTDLTGTLMPFIRYDQLDMVVVAPGASSDDRGWRRLERVEGRDDDFAVMPDGSHIPFHVFYEIMDKYEKINQFRIIQKSVEYYQILIMADKDYIRSIHDDIIENYSLRFPENVRFEVM
ncbi:unnamed protein product, partial [marine sediment metagenome]